MNSLIEVTQTVLLIPTRLLGQVEYSPLPRLKARHRGLFWMGLLHRVHYFEYFVDRSKAGQPGWASIVPIYNYIVWCKIVGRPAWWVLLLLICFPIVHIILSIDLAKSFGKGVRAFDGSARCVVFCRLIGKSISLSLRRPIHGIR